MDCILPLAVDEAVNINMLVIINTCYELIYN